MRLYPVKQERISPYGQRVRPPQRCFKRGKFWFLAVDPEAASGHKGRPSERSAAWLAHQSGGLGVGGSNPLAPTNLFKVLVVSSTATQIPWGK